jgi:hypothetical protein
MVFQGNGYWTLNRIDTASLEPVGKGVYVGRGSGSWAFSPDRSLLALAAETISGNGIVRILDPTSLRQRGALRLAGPAGPVAWPRRDRVLAISSGPSDNRLQAVVYNPLTHRVVRRTEIAGGLFGVARTPAGLVLLLAPSNRIGPASLALVAPSGAVRSTGLGISAGSKPPTGPPYLFERRVPGFAVDPAGKRAFVVPAGGTVLEVELPTLAVRTRELSRPVSLLGRLRNWLEPAAQAKASEGPTRTARWLGNELIAVSGSDSRAIVRAGKLEEQTTTPAGLTLIDTRTWSVRTLDVRASIFVFADGLLLATGTSYDSVSGQRSTMGLVAYSPSGQKRFALFPDREPWVSTVLDGRAYVGFGGGPGQTLSIVELATGRIVGERNGIMPALLLGAADPWWG